MEISDNVLCLFSAEITDRDNAYVIEVPKNELTVGELQQGVSYSIAIVSRSGLQTSQSAEKRAIKEQDPDLPEPPVEAGETRLVDIEDIGEQGDGIARVERGYVVVVPDTEINERVEIEIIDVKQTVAFGEVTERETYYQ